MLLLLLLCIIFFIYFILLFSVSNKNKKGKTQKKTNEYSITKGPKQNYQVEAPATDQKTSHRTCRMSCRDIPQQVLPQCKYNHHHSILKTIQKYTITHIQTHQILVKKSSLLTTYIPLSHHHHQKHNSI